MAIPCYDGGASANLTSTGNVSGTTTNTGQLYGFYVNSTSSGTLILKSGGSSGTALGGTITPAVGFHRYPATFTCPLHATIGGTLDVTLFFNNIAS